MKNRIRRIFSFISRHKIATRVLSMSLSLILLFYAIPTVVYGEVIDALSKPGDTENAGSSASVLTDFGSQGYNAEYPLYEITELREENVKHFRLRDGSYVAAQYTSAVHYRDGLGAWQDIDNTLSSDGTESLLTPDARVKFSKKINGSGNVLKIKSGDYEIDLSVLGGNKGVSAESVSFSDAEELTELQKMLNLEKLSSAVTYRGMFSGADMEYILHSYNTEERIIINEKSSAYVYSFELKLKGLTAEPSEDGGIVFLDAKTKAAVYKLPKPQITDSNGDLAPLDACWYTLKNDGNKYTLTLEVNAELLNSSYTFPVSVSTNYKVNTTEEKAAYEIGEIRSEKLNATYVKLNSLPEIPESAYTSEIILTLSEETPSTTYALYEVTSDWDSESISYESYTEGVGALAEAITDASSESFSFNITELAEKWQSSYESNFGVAIVALDGTAENEAMLAYSMRSAVSPAVAVAYASSEGVEDYFSYTSQSIGSAGNVSINNATGRLTLAIPTISNNNQIMPLTISAVYNSYLSNKAYISQNAETFYTSKFLPYGFKLNVMESVIEKSYTDTGGITKKYYVYEDSDGTGHAFFETSETGVYKDADGLQKTLTFNSNESEVYINDDSKIERRFVSVTGFSATSEISRAWCILTLKDEFGNILGIQGDNYSREPEVVTPSKSESDSSIRSGARIEILYQSVDNGVCAIFNTNTKDFAIFRFSSTYNGEVSASAAKNYLRQVEVGYGSSTVSYSKIYGYYNNPSSNSGLTITKKANYEYDSSGRLTKATDAILGKSIAYTWDDLDKVIRVTEYAGTAKGQEISFSYGTGFTDVRSTGNDEILETPDDIFTRYIFDDAGRCISLYSYSEGHGEIYGATTGKYETQENVKNNLKEQVTVGGSSVNYLLNGDFEQRNGTNGLAYWNLSAEAYSDRNTTHNTHGHYSLRLNPEIGSTAYAEQYVFLKAGTYTLSMLTQTQESEGHSAYTEISSLSGSGLNHTESISLNPNGLNGIRGTFSTTFTVLAHTNGGDNVKVKIAISSTASAPRKAAFYVDDVSLSKGINASDYSYVKYGTFEESGINSSGNVSVAMSDHWKTQSGGAPAIADSESPFGKAVKVTANNGTSYVKQRVYELDAEYLHRFDYDPLMYVDNIGAEFLVTGFAKANGVASSDSEKFELRVDVIYYQGVGKEDVVVSYSYEFVPTAKGWQFVSGAFDTAHERASGDTNDYSCIKAIDICCDYSNHTNQPNQSEGYALFDNVSLVIAEDNNIEKYYYEESGLLVKKEAATYKEYYLYYSGTRRLGRMANNRGEMTDYYYTNASAPDTVTETITYDFKNFGTYDYPFTDGINPDYFTATPKTKTVYEYNAYGLMTSKTTFEIEYDTAGYVVKKSGSKSISESYTYIIYHSNGYSLSYANLGSMETSTDSLGITTRYFYDTDRGYLLATVNESTGDGIAYTYDTLGNLSYVTPAEYVSATQYNSVSGAESVSYTYNANNLLSTISTQSTVYTLNYDVFGNSSSVQAGNNTLASYEYNQNNGKLKKITYGNGFAVEYVYNRLEMVSEIWYTESGTRSLKYSYEYTDDGQVYKFTDHEKGKSTVYRYDNVGKLVSFSEYDNSDMYHDFSLDVYYDSNRSNDVSGMYYKLNYTSTTPKSVSEIYYNYARDPDGIITKTSIETIATNGYEEFTYDAYDRVSAKEIYFYIPTSDGSGAHFDNDISYEYKSNYEETSTSALVYSYTSKVNDQTSQIDLYDYDDNGNITSIVSGTNDKIVVYTYDDLGQLIREDNQFLNVTYVYEYDNAGNITAVKKCNYTLGSYVNVIETKTYTYSASGWGDLLTAYNGAQITYDAAGNPLTYNNGTAYTFTWNGRQLVSATKGGNTYSFTYNDSGYRTSKTVNGVTTTYYLNGSQIIAEETNGNMTVYLYDTAGLPVGMQYHKATDDENTWEIYWFEKNMQGDIVAVYNQAGTKLVSYQYDAWGNAITSYHNGGASTKAADNPFTYRGYYYDKDLEMYYLGSRYYDSVVKRFINADKMIATTDGTLEGKNLYAYCFNNPVMFTDESGNWPKWIKKAVSWVIEKVAAWKEESFLYNVVISNVTVDLGAGIGVGGSLELGSFEISAISRMDILGVETNVIDWKWGHHGRSAYSIGFKDFSIGEDYKTFESFGGKKEDAECTSPAFDFSVGGEIGVVISGHLQVSVSFSGMYNDFKAYGRKREWW